MPAKILLLALTALVLPNIQLAEAQQPKKVPRMGLLFPGSQSAFAIWTEVPPGPARAGYQRLKLA